MKLYTLTYLMYDPSNGGTEPDKYMADIPAIPVCRVRGFEGQHPSGVDRKLVWPHRS